ncbi:MAG: 50S ribosomal protein L30 [Bacilli bacterium]
MTAKKAPKAKKSKKQLKITLIKSANGAKPNQVKTVEALGLTKLNSEIIQPDNEAIRGMIFTIKHLVKVEEQ